MVMERFLVVSHFFSETAPVCLLVQFDESLFLLPSSKIDFKFMIYNVMISCAKGWDELGTMNQVLQTPLMSITWSAYSCANDGCQT